MTSILCEAFTLARKSYFHDREPPAALISTASIFSALAPRASRFCILTPPLLALLRRSPFFCFTQHFVLGDVTDEVVCDIIRNCVAIKSLDIQSSDVTGSFIHDAILSTSGSYITRTLEHLSWYGKGDTLVPLLAPSTSPMSPTFLRSMTRLLLLHTRVWTFSPSSKTQLLASSLDALEGRQEALWEPALMLAAYLVHAESRVRDDQGASLIDERIVRRCIAIVEELIDAEERVALLAVELLARLLDDYAELIVPLLLAESDALRGVLMLCDRFTERIKRGERVAGGSLLLSFQSPPLRTINAAIRAVLEVAPTVDVLDVLSYRDNETKRVRTILDVLAAYRNCPKVREVEQAPREVRHFRLLVADPEHGVEACHDLYDCALRLLAYTWPKPFNIARHPARQQLLDMIAERTQPAFAMCDNFTAIDVDSVAVDPKDTDADAIISRDIAMLEAFRECIRITLTDIDCALNVVDQVDERLLALHERANAHASPLDRALDSVLLFNFVMSIRRHADGDSETAGATQTFADVLLALFRTSMRLRRNRDLMHVLDSTLARLDEDCANAAGYAASFLAHGVRDCAVVLAAAEATDGDDRRRQRPEDEQELAEAREAGRAAAIECAVHIEAILRAPDVVHALVLLEDEFEHAEELLSFAVERGCVSAADLAALRAAVDAGSEQSLT
jgi:hypothetical protein